METGHRVMTAKTEPSGSCVRTTPSSTVGMINVPFRGRELKVGERTFENWVVTVINDEDFKLRTAFEKWVTLESRLSDNTGVTEPSSYMSDALCSTTRTWS